MLTLHLHTKQRHEEVQQVSAWAWPSVHDITRADGDIDRGVWNSEMQAVTFYNEAVCYKEEEHIPLIGPSVHRRILSLMYKLLNSETVKAYCCFPCANEKTYVRKWAKFHRHDDGWESSWAASEMRLFPV